MFSNKINFAKNLQLKSFPTWKVPDILLSNSFVFSPCTHRKLVLPTIEALCSLVCWISYSLGELICFLDTRPMSRLVFRSSGDLLHSLQLLFKISSITNFPLQYKVHCGALSAKRPGVFAFDLFHSWPNESKIDRTHGNHMIVQLLCVYLLCLCARRLWSFVSSLANTCFLQNSHTCR